MIDAPPASGVGVAAAGPAVHRGRLVNAFSVDVEDYFQVEAFRDVVDRAAWEEWPARVVGSTERVLALLEAAGVSGTFFVLGWIAERFPELVRRIHAGGHEIASHGHAHELVSRQTPAVFREDVRRAKCVLEDCAGVSVRGYRAPTFSIRQDNWWAYEVMHEEGYEYSSSVYPITHDLYGMPSASRTPFCPIPTSGFLEIPIATIRLLGSNRPCGGGGFFRLLPYAFSRWCLARVNDTDRSSCVFYCHPWEFDPDQPHVSQAPLKSRFRHYLNIGRMEQRVRWLLQDFAWGRIDEIYLSHSKPVATVTHRCQP
jgi:polysaccharide deacetylase family protein (PEP-CTERM system associated)